MRSTVTVQSALVVRQLRISLDFDEDTVAHMQQRAASAVASAANALEDDCGPSRCRHLLPGLRTPSYAESEFHDSSYDHPSSWWPDEAHSASEFYRGDGGWHCPSSGQ